MGQRLRLTLSVDGLARTRLAHSPLLEAVNSIRCLADPSLNPVHRPWALAARTRVDGIDTDMLLALWSDCPAVPDFLTPPPVPGTARIEDELERVRATSAEQVRRDLAITFGDRLPAPLERLHRKPSAGLDALVRLLHAYWERALADHWPRLRLVLEGDVVFRTRALASGGAVAVFGALHERVQWDAGDVVVGAPGDLPDHCVDVTDGLLLVPSAFVWPYVATVFRPPWMPAIIYPSRGTGTLWETGAVTGSAALAALIGRTRAGLLALLDAPLSTTELAHRSGLSVPSASRHLAVLREAGLVASHRHGHAIVHQPTELGLSLLAGDGDGRSAAAG